MYLALDQGTTSSRAIAFDESGRELGRAQEEFEQHYPAEGHVEHDPDEIFRSQWRTAREAHRAAGGGEVQGVGITNQRETVVVFERATGKPIHRAIVWQDRRTAGALRQLREKGHEDRVRECTGLPLDPYFSAAKIAWILDHVSGAREAAERGELGACTVDSWLVHRLTGGEVFATEPSNACRTSLFDIEKCEWSGEMLELFSVPRACLPEIRPSAADFGAVEETGWPIRGILGDQQAALFGHACLEPGEAKCTYGTGAFLLRHCGEERPRSAHGLLASIGWQLDGTTVYVLEGSLLVCGAAIQWLRDGLGVIGSSSEAESIARSVPDSGGVVLVPAFAGLGTPHWDPYARGLLIGITRGTTKAHVVRAAIEAMALQVHDVQQAMRESTGAPLRELRVDGGAAANDLLLELQAALDDVPVVRPAFLETTAFGAFRAAALGSGAASRASDLPKDPEPPMRIDPDRMAGDLQPLLRRWQKAVERCRHWVD